MGDQGSVQATCDHDVVEWASWIDDREAAIDLARALGVPVIVFADGHRFAFSGASDLTNQAYRAWYGSAAYGIVQRDRVTHAVTAGLQANWNHWRWQHAARVWDDTVGALQARWSAPLLATDRLAYVGCKGGWGDKGHWPARSHNDVGTTMRVGQRPAVVAAVQARPSWETLVGPVTEGQWSDLRGGIYPGSLTKGQRTLWERSWDLVVGAPVISTPRTSQLAPVPTDPGWASWGAEYLETFGRLQPPTAYEVAQAAKAELEPAPTPASGAPRGRALVAIGLAAASAGVLVWQRGKIGAWIR